MHQKKRKLFVLYSIPIWFRKKFSRLNLCNKEKLYLVSYSIPLSCMVVLLLGLGLMVNPGLFLVDKSSAVTIQDEWVVKENDSTSANQNMGSADQDEVDSVSENALDSLEEGVSRDATVSDGDYGVMPLADAGITFSIGGAAKDATIEATPGEVAYREHTVTVNLTNADEYALLISGNSEITSDGNSAAKLVGMTNATTGSDIPTGEWGYGWDYTGSKSKEEMTYQAVPSAQTEILTPQIDSTTNTISFTGKLNFAGKFPEGAAFGSYTGGTARLMLVVSAKGNTGGAVWKKADGSDTNYYSGINAMQEIDTVTRDGGFCKDNPIIQTGWTIELQDNRGPNPVESYKIVKLRDGNCWMQQNLRLKLTKNTKIEGSKIDGSAYSWTVPTNDKNWNFSATTQDYSTSGTWTSDAAVVMSRAGTGTNGNYYTWCAATAGTCLSAASSGVVAPASICPKGWHLPTGNEFYGLFGANGINLGGTSSNTSADYQTRLNAIKALPYLFPAAGYVVSNGSLDNGGSDGIYWSSTAYSNTTAYYLLFNSSYFIPGTNLEDRYYGYSVRCVANY